MTSGAPDAARPKVAIVGGGISGVTAAYELAVRHPDIAFTLFEASGRVGGTIETVHEGGFTIECGPDSWVTEKPWARELAEELGLGEEIIPSNDHLRVTYIARGSQLLPMPDGMRMMVPTRWEPVLHSPLLSWEARLAYLREPKRAQELRESALAGRGEDADESVADFVLRHFGEEVSRTFAAPLLSGVFGGDIEKLSVRAVMAPFVTMEAEHGSLIEALRLRALASTEKPATFTSLRSGLGKMIDRMVERIPVASIALHAAVTRITKTTDGWQIATPDAVEAFDSVMLATPAHVTRVLLNGLQDAAASEAASLLPIEASSSIVVALGFGREKDSALHVPRGFGFLVPQTNGDTQESLLACTFVDQKFAHRAEGGGVLLRGFFGGATAERLASQSDADLAKLTRTQLARWLGPLPEADVCVVRRWPRSLPQYFVGHVERMVRLEQVLTGLDEMRLLGNAYCGVGLPDLIRDAREAVRSTAKTLRISTKML